jgi:hypothetical protein
LSKPSIPSSSAEQKTWIESIHGDRRNFLGGSSWEQWMKLTDATKGNAE